MIDTILAGHYQIVEHLGGGGFGQTFLARDNHLPGTPLCVVKQLKLEYSDRETLEVAKRLFEREAETLYKLGDRSDRIPRLMAHFEQEGEFYLVQEFIEGQPLDVEITTGKQLPESEIVALLRDILEVLSFVHQQNVIHRDIKPANLIRRKQDNKIVLIDFGAVKEVRQQATPHTPEDRGLTVAVGSPGYMPSEQLAGQPHFSSDIYALGILCLTALTGLSPKDLPKDCRTGEYRCDLLGKTISIDLNFAAILDRMVRYDYRQRYENAVATLQELEQLTSGGTMISGLTSSDPQTTGSLNLENPEGKVPLYPTTYLDRSPMDQDKSPRYPDGAVPLGSPFYLERAPFEKQVYQEIRKPGALLRIKAPREMGKTSLLLRILDSAKGLGYRTVSLNLEQVDQAILRDLNQFLRWLCANVARQLRLKPKLDEYWDEDLGSKISCTLYFQDYLLESIDTPLVLALDEVHQVFEHPQVAKDFLPLLRSWYEEAKRLPIWQKLRLIVVHSTEIYVPLQLNQSPFNVGLPIQLNNFSKEEVQQLAQCYGLDWEDGEEARQLMDMVGGHPALVQIALYHLSSGEVTLAQLLETAPKSTGIYDNHLQRHLVTLEEQPELAQALDTVMSATKPIPLAPMLAYKLSSLGLIERSGDKVIPSCELYRRYFLEVKSPQH